MTLALQRPKTSQHFIRGRAFNADLAKRHLLCTEYPRTLYRGHSNILYASANVKITSTVCSSIGPFEECCNVVGGFIGLILTIGDEKGLRKLNRRLGKELACLWILGSGR